jgi:hypothetical protein
VSTKKKERSYFVLCICFVFNILFCLFVFVAAALVTSHDHLGVYVLSMFYLIFSLGWSVWSLVAADFNLFL